MSFVGVKDKGEKGENSTHVNGEKGGGGSKKQKVETPRGKEGKDNNIDKDKSRLKIDKKDKTGDDEKLLKELEKSKNVIADLKDQLI